MFWKGLWRKAASRLSGRDVAVRGRCLRCGSCCRDLTLVINGRTISGTRDLKTLHAHAEDYRRFLPSGRDPEGNITVTCTYLGEDGACTVYDERPAICREHPARDLYYVGGDPGEGCGYRFERTRSFSAMLRRARRQARREARLTRSGKGGAP